MLSEFIKFTGNGDGREAGRLVGSNWCGAYISWEINTTIIEDKMILKQKQKQNK